MPSQENRQICFDGPQKQLKFLILDFISLLTNSTLYSKNKTAHFGTHGVRMVQFGTHSVRMGLGTKKELTFHLFNNVHTMYA